MITMVKRVMKAINALFLVVFSLVMLCAVDLPLFVSTALAGELENELIQQAGFCNSLTSVRALIEKGANLNAKDKDGQTALMKAVWMVNCNADVVRLLIEKGANVNVYDKTGRTALMTAANYGQADIVRALIEKGADMNAQDNNGNTALMLASGSSPHKDVVLVLIEKGANLNLPDQNNQTALDSARFMKGVGKADFGFGPQQQRDIEEIVRMLERAGARANVWK